MTTLKDIQKADKAGDETLKRIKDADLGFLPLELPDDYSFPSKLPDDYKMPKGFEKDDFPFIQVPVKRERHAFDYDDVQLIPKKGMLEHRKNAETWVKFGGFLWKLPILPANMSSVINTQLCLLLAQNSYLYCMHRFCTDEERLQFAKDIKKEDLPLSMAFGVKKEEFNLAEKIKEEGLNVDLLWIDVAHGYSVIMKDSIKRYKQIFPNAFIIAGNVAEVEGAKFLEKAGADAVKLGIGHGEACITRLKTGFSNFGWQLSAVEEAANELKVPIVCDGGVHEHGDIAKALVMGATVCMAGSMFSALIDSPGNIIEKDGLQYKEYFGSASARQKKNGSNQPVNVEGKCILKPLRDHDLLTEMKWIEEDLQSAISYAGGYDISAFNNVEYIITC